MSWNYQKQDTLKRKLSLVESSGKDDL